MKPFRVILLPGSVLPARPAYAGLLEALGPDVDAVAKDLEVYAGDAPPTGWTLDSEVDGVLREADARGWDAFHLVGYSGGGAVALALPASNTGRLRSCRHASRALGAGRSGCLSLTRRWGRGRGLSAVRHDGPHRRKPSRRSRPGS